MAGLIADHWDRLGRPCPVAVRDQALLGVTMRDFSAAVLRQGRTLAESYGNLLPERSGDDVERIWRWAYLERVSTGLYVLGLGSEAVARPYLDSAALLLAPT